MLNFIKKMSLVPKGLRYKTMIAFSLMSLIPLLISFWLAITYIFPNTNILGLSLGNISFILIIALFISVLGLYLTKEMIDPVIKIADDARVMAEGNTDKIIEVSREDEIGDLGTSLNIMTQKIRNNIEELKTYGEQTKLINIEINKKVLALSSLLQIGNLISSTNELIPILDFIAEKVSDVEDGSISFVMMLDEPSREFKAVTGSNIEEHKLKGLRIKEGEIPPRIIIKDKNTSAKMEAIDRLIASLEIKNTAILPIVVSKKMYGLLGVGNRKEDFVFKEDEQELLKVFAKQAVIAVENDLLITKAKDLAVKDELTGLYNQKYMHSRLDEEIKRACMYQRPCGYLLIDMDNFKNFREQYGEVKAESLLKALAEVLKLAVTEIDKVGRLTDDKFAVVLPEKNKKQSAAIAEAIRKKVEDGLGKIMKASGNLTVSIGVSENPIDGSTADELIEKAEKLLKSAKSLGKNRVAV